MENIKIINTKDNKDCILVNINDKFKALGSKYNFSNDLNKLIKDIENNDINIETTIVILGLYNGEYIDELQKTLDTTNRIIIIEFNKEVYEKYKNKVSHNVELYLYDDFFRTENLILKSKNLKIFEFGNYAKIYEDECKKLYREFRNEVVSIKVNENTLNKFSKTWFECILGNFPVILESDNLSNFKNIFKGYPAVIVSAGPSLEKNIKTLKELQDKVVIISGGRTLKPLLDNGITPTLVCVVDPGEGSYNVIKGSLDTEIPLVADEVSSSKVVTEYKGKKIFYNDNSLSEFMDYFLDKGEKAFLASGGSVAHTSTELARYLGCKDIIFVGQDLAYTDSKHHADIANISKSSKQNDFELMVDDIYGKKVGTSFVLNHFRVYFENYINFYKNEMRFINATEGGANIIGTEIKTLKEVVDEFGKTNKKIPKIEIKRYFKDVDKAKIAQKFKKLIIDLKKIKIMAKEILKSNDEFFKYSKINRNNINKYIVNIENKEKKIMKNIKSLYAINIVLKYTIEEVTKFNLYIPKKSSSYEDKIKLSYLQTKSLYQEISAKCNFCIETIKKTLGENIEKL